MSGTAGDRDRGLRRQRAPLAPPRTARPPAPAGPRRPECPVTGRRPPRRGEKDPWNRGRHP
ncbi:hypothetical protein GCM10018793_14960 [Streptomyces sulfonofaciens]|uniref:Uncharacterized protein n=1 Tax=Streptomyces sulfonofaciens TaxID=68272 RepID=A0A919FXJ0_9ACTN|nr:hypothetical protein GCM10018793_14960 [Streptomyces sulfonofaciens]